MSNTFTICEKLEHIDNSIYLKIYSTCRLSKRIASKKIFQLDHKWGLSTTSKVFQATPLIRPTRTHAHTNYKVNKFTEI